MDGVAAATEIRAEFPDAQILFLTSYDTQEKIHRAMKAGATINLPKHSKRKEFVSAIREAAAGR